MAQAARDENRVPTIIGVDSTFFSTPKTVGVNNNHEMLVNSTVKGMLVNVDYDYVGVTYPDTSTEVYTFKTGGSGGTTVATVTLVYSDAGTKNILSSVTKS